MARKLYELKPLDSGQQLSFGEHIYTIWSAGPEPSTVWAYDEEGTWAVLRTRKGQVAYVSAIYPGVSPNALLHAALAVLRGHPYFGVKRATTRGQWTHVTSTVISKVLHVDPDCPHAEEEREPVSPERQSYLSRLLVNGELAPGLACGCVFEREGTRSAKLDH